MLEALFAGATAGLVAWGTVRVELYFIKRAIEAAHERLDKINAPPARLRL